ncbi:MAG: amidase family protein [Steroidobacteraceae bacterium]
MLPEARRARAAAFCITSASGAQLHRQRLHTRPQDFDPVTRDRFYAGLRLPATVAIQAQRLRRWFAAAASELFRHVDVLLAPATPGTAPLIGQKTIMLGDTEVSTRQNIGVYTQPISFIGLPVVAVPVWTASRLPIGVQVIAPPWQEGLALRVAAQLERTGVCTVRKTDA